MNRTSNQRQLNAHALINEFLLYWFSFSFLFSSHFPSFRSEHPFFAVESEKSAKTMMNDASFFLNFALSIAKVHRVHMNYSFLTNEFRSFRFSIEFELVFDVMMTCCNFSSLQFKSSKMYPRALMNEFFIIHRNVGITSHKSISKFVTLYSNILQFSFEQWLHWKFMRTIRMVMMARRRQAIVISFSTRRHVQFSRRFVCPHISSSFFHMNGDWKIYEIILVLDAIFVFD